MFFSNLTTCKKSLTNSFRFDLCRYGRYNLKLSGTKQESSTLNGDESFTFPPLSLDILLVMYNITFFVNLSWN
jgi:hypothetical protein